MVSSVFMSFYVFGSWCCCCLIVQELGITSDEALSLEDLPKRAVVLGGGCVCLLMCF